MSLSVKRPCVDWGNFHPYFVPGLSLSGSPVKKPLPAAGGPIRTTIRFFLGLSSASKVRPRNRSAILRTVACILLGVPHK